MPSLRLVYNNLDNLTNLRNADNQKEWQEIFYQHTNRDGPYKNAKHYSINNLPDESFIYDLQYTREVMGQPDFYDPKGNKHALVLNHIPSEVTKRVLEGTAYFSVVCVTEAHVSHNMIDQMSQYFMHYNIPLDRVLYITNAANGSELIAEHAKDRNLNKTIQHVYFPYLMEDHKRFYSDDTQFESKFEDLKKDFLCFNWRHHTHRALFYALMSKHDLVKHSYYSMTELNWNKLTVKQTIQRMISPTDQERLGLVESEIDYAMSKLPLKLEQDFDTATSINTGYLAPSLYRKSMVSIVTETNFFEPAVHLTEKTYKPISFGHPFIIVACPGTLKHLKQQGFQTFDRFWSESYDTIEDPIRRMNELIITIKGIQNWTLGRKSQFMKDVKPIVEHNMRLIGQKNRNLIINSVMEKYAS